VVAAGPLEVVPVHPASRSAELEKLIDPLDDTGLTAVAKMIIRRARRDLR
jgi:hypothetical protein